MNSSGELLAVYRMHGPHSVKPMVVLPPPEPEAGTGGGGRVVAAGGPGLAPGPNAGSTLPETAP